VEAFTHEIPKINSYLLSLSLASLMEVWACIPMYLRKPRTYH